MALINTTAIDPNSKMYAIEQLKLADFHSHRRWSPPWRFTHIRYFLWNKWQDTDELDGQPSKVVKVTGLCCLGFQYHTWTKLPKPLGWGMDFGIKSDEAGIVIQKIKKSSRKTRGKTRYKRKAKIK